MDSVNRIVTADRLQDANEQETPVVTPVRRLRRIAWLSAAACVLLLLVGSIIYLANWRAKPALPVATKPVLHDALPGTNGAVLTLADGSRVVLDSLGNGIVASQNGATVMLEDGKLQYKPAKGATEDITYNTMATPRGRQFRLTLPDGSRVWINAASAIRYPVHFAGGTRVVELSGEAYFEVAVNKEKPFIVQLPGNNSIEVTGTHFNVKAYTDEAFTKTTLLEGAVTVKTTERTRNMQPGQQTRITAGGAIAFVPNASTQQATAWMSRSFSFQEDDLETILKQLARWYDIEIKYEGGIPKKTFTSNVSMDNNLSDILTVLSQSGLKFSLENGVLHIL
jgi:ferric-dicitrate binding protein FerR (iron transport regulator)